MKKEEKKGSSATKNVLKAEEKHRRQVKVYDFLYYGLSARKYKPYESLSEIVDNSIGAEATQCIIKINEDKIIIRDNGLGQDAVGLGKCMDIARPNTSKNRGGGKYGLGLKQAALSLGRKFTVITKPKHSKNVYSASISLDDIDEHKPKEMKDFFIDIHESVYSGKAVDSFFEVIIKDLNQNLSDFLIEQVMEGLSSNYKKFINNGFKIKVNDKIIKKPKNPTTIFKETFTFNDLGVSGYWAVVKKREKGRTKHYGFDMYYGDRLITVDDVEIADIHSKHPNFYRLHGEINILPSSNIKPVSAKHEWVKNESYFELQKRIMEIVDNKYKPKLKEYQDAEMKTKAFMGAKSIGNKVIERVVKIIPGLSVTQTRIKRVNKKELPDGSALLVIEKRNKGDKKGTVKPKGTARRRKPKKTHLSVKPVTFYIDKKPIKLNIIPNDDGKNNPRYVCDYDDKNLNIFVNVTHPLLMDRSGNSFFEKVVVIFVECILQFLEKETVIDVMDREEIINTIDSEEIVKAAQREMF